MTIISRPSVTVQKVPGQLEQSLATQKVLFIGQKLTGTAAAGQLVSSIGNNGEEDALFGANSQLAGAVRAFKKINKITQLDAIALADVGAGTAASGKVTFATNSSSAGTISVVVGSAINHKYDLAITSGLTPTQIGDLLVAAITADTDAPFAGVNTTGDVVITFDHKGTVGNETSLWYESDVSGTTVTLTAFASGATDPTLTSTLDVVGNTRYQTISHPEGYGISFSVTNFLDERFNADNNVLDGVLILSETDTLANLKANEGAYNSESLVVVGYELVNDSDHKGSDTLEFDYVKSALFAAVRALRLTEDSNLADYVIAPGGYRDYFGGAHMASFPYMNTPIPYMPLPEAGHGFEETEILELAAKGISVIGSNISLSDVIAGEIFTTYKTNSAGNADTTWHYLNAVDTASSIAEYIWLSLRSDFAQTRLTSGDLIPGYSMANEEKIKERMVYYYKTLSDSGYVLATAGDEAVEYFRANLDVVLDLSQGKATIGAKCVIVSQLRELLANIQILYSQI